MTAIRAAMAFIPAQLTHFRGWKLNQSGASGTRETVSLPIHHPSESADDAWAWAW
jgi:hypothetical protein